MPTTIATLERHCAPLPQARIAPQAISARPYTPPSQGLDGHELDLEPARFAITGAGLLRNQLRPEFFGDAMAYSLDAPPHIPQGSVDGYLAKPTVEPLKPWHWLGTSVARERGFA